MSYSQHDEHTRLISLKPEIIGLTGIVLSTGEANLRNEKGIICRQPDNLCFDPSTKTLYNIEYKCNNTPSTYHHAKVQLHDTKEMLTQIFTDMRIVNLYVSKDYKIEVIN